MESRKPNPAEFWKATDKKTQNHSLWSKERPGETYNASANEALSNAGSAASAALPTLTTAGIAMLCQGTGSNPLNIFGLPIAIGGIVIDAIKAPVCLAIAGEESVRGGVLKLASALFDKKNPSQAAIDRIFASFLKRMQETATLLIHLGLEEQNVLDSKLQSGDIEELVALTLLHTAYISRHYRIGILLASEKMLEKDNCPAEGLPLFNEVMELKLAIIAALDLAKIPANLSDMQRELEESKVVCQWIKLIKTGKDITAMDKPDATTEQIAAVNKVIAKVNDLKLLGMSTMPEPTEAVVNRLKK